MPRPYTLQSIIGAELRGAVVVHAFVTTGGTYRYEDGDMFVLNLDRDFTDDDGFTYDHRSQNARNGIVVDATGRPLFATVKKGERFVKRRKKKIEVEK